jgi:hypothetical protein
MEDCHATGEGIVSGDKLFQAIPNDCKQAHDFVVVNAGVKTLTQEKGHSEEWPKSLILMVGTGRFELPTPCTPCEKMMIPRDSNEDTYCTFYQLKSIT